MKKIRFERLYYILLVLYIFNQVFSESHFVDFWGMALVLTFVRYLVLVILVIIIISKNIKIKKQIAIISILMLTFIISNMVFAGGGISYIPIFLFAIASKNFSLDKIFKYTIYSIIYSHLMVILATKVGILQDTVDFRYVGKFTGSVLSGAYYRHDMGFLVHNQIALAYMIVYLYIIAYKRENIKFYENVLLMILNYIIFCLFGSRIVFLLTMLVCILFYVLKAFGKKNSRIKYFWTMSYIVCACVSLTFTLAYKSENQWWKIVDMIFNNRISQANEAIKYFGVGILGAGKNAGLYSSISSNAFTIDNGYICIMISEGVGILLILIGIWTYLIYLAEKHNNKYMVLVLVILALENIINTHLGSFKLIPFFCILLNENDDFLCDKFNGNFRLRNQ